LGRTTAGDGNAKHPSQIRDGRKTRGATPVRLTVKEKPCDVAQGKPASLVTGTAQYAIPFAVITVATPAQATWKSVRPATRRSILHGGAGRFSPSPALCAVRPKRTRPRQSLCVCDFKWL